MFKKKTEKSHSQNIQKNFRTVVTCKSFFFRITSPNAPNAKPENNLAKYGKLAKIPACAKLKPSTSLINIGAADIKKNKPHKLP